MNDNQRMVLIAVVGIVLLMLLFPPFQIRFATGVVRNLGYGFLLSPPVYSSYSYPDTPGAVNIGMLVTQWVGIIIAGAVAFFMLKDR
jgi:hypothetical protein